MNPIDLLKKITDRFDPLFEKVQGGYFAILTTISGILTILIASILYYTVEPFTLFSHWISNLGGVSTNSGKSPNGSNIVFSVGLIIMTILATPFVLYLAKILLSDQQKFPILILIAIIYGIATGIGVIGVAIFDIKSQAIIHVIFACIFFVNASFMVLFFSFAILFNSNVSKIQSIAGFFMFSVGIIFLLNFLQYVLKGGDPLLGITSTDPKLALTRFWEWMFLFVYLTWFFEMGLYILIREKSI